MNKEYKVHMINEIWHKLKPINAKSRAKGILKNQLRKEVREGWND